MRHSILPTLPAATDNSPIDRQLSKLPEELKLTLSVFWMNTCVRLAGFYVLRGFSMICLHTSPRLVCNAAARGKEWWGERWEKKYSPAHSSVLISSLSSTLLTHPRVTTTVRCWHFWDRKPTHLLCFGERWVAIIVVYLFTYLFFTFCLSNTGRVLLHFTKKLKLNNPLWACP